MMTLELLAVLVLLVVGTLDVPDRLAKVTAR